MYKYKFSIIIPIYNLEKYLDEAISSILGQTIGFKENIELILVNDGSTDNSEKICLKYQKRYPDNVVYVKKKNSGVSMTRNKGLSLSKGKYINFFDGDDFWNKEDFEKVWNFFEEHYDDIDVVSCRQKFFEGATNYVALDYKFKNGNQVVDINKKPDYIHASVCSSFFKFEAIKAHKFDKNLKLGEDAKFLNEIILEKEKYGLLSDVTHNIRRRYNKTSATQNIYKDKTRYINTVLGYYEYMYEYSRKKYEKVIPYVQFLIMNAIKYRVIETLPDILSKKEKETYINKLINIIKQTDDEVLYKLKNVHYSTILLLLKLKHESSFDKLISFENGKIKFNDKTIITVKKKPLISLETIKINDEICEITGVVKVPFFESVSSIYVKKNQSVIDIKLNDKDSVVNEFLGEELFKNYTFKVSFNLEKDINKLKFYIESNIRKNAMIIDCSDKLFNFRGMYLKLGKKMVLKDKEDTLIIKNYKFKRVVKLFCKRKI